MAKKKQPKIPQHLLASSLRPRMDEAWGDVQLVEREQGAVFDRLDGLARGVGRDFLLSTMLRAYNDASPSNRERLGQVVPAWLRERAHLDTLKTLVADPTLEASLQETAVEWLEAAGVDPVDIEVPEPEDLFFAAYGMDNGMQGHLSMMWYSNTRRDRAAGLGFLIDHNPPWEGAVKDIMRYPTRPQQDLVSTYIESWNERAGSEVMEPLDMSEAVAWLLDGLEANENAGIRLPRDLTRERTYFAQQVMPLIERVEPGSFTMKQFDELSKRGESPERLSQFEQRFGYRTRMEDGGEVLILRGPEDLDLE